MTLLLRLTAKMQAEYRSSTTPDSWRAALAAGPR
jgi:hypothetical protein